jgi:hypothetical protein
MRTEGRHEWLEMVVIQPSNEEEAGERALAISPTVFGEFAPEPGNEIPLPAAVGAVILREGMHLEAYGNTGAHNGAEVSPVDLAILDEQ